MHSQRHTARISNSRGGTALRCSSRQSKAEAALANHLLQAASVVSPLLQQGDYAQALKHLAKLKAPTDRFFEEVRVMVEDSALRQNRLALLRHLADLFLAIADFSHLQPSE